MREEVVSSLFKLPSINRQQKIKDLVTLTKTTVDTAVTTYSRDCSPGFQKKTPKPKIGFISVRGKFSQPCDKVDLILQVMYRSWKDY